MQKTHLRKSWSRLWYWLIVKQSKLRMFFVTPVQSHVVQYYNAESCLGNIGVAQSAAVHLGLYRLYQHWRAEHQTTLWPPDVPAASTSKGMELCEKMGRGIFLQFQYFYYSLHKQTSGSNISMLYTP